MRTRSFTIPGEPVAKGRPKMTRMGRAYTPEKTVNYESLVKLMYLNEYPGCAMLTGPMDMRVKAYFQIPKSVSKKKHEAMMKGLERPTKRPDGDNILKAVADALNGLAYPDDSSIVTATVEKYWGTPRVEVELKEVGA